MGIQRYCFLVGAQVSGRRLLTLRGIQNLKHPSAVVFHSHSRHISHDLRCYAKKKKKMAQVPRGLGSDSIHPLLPRSSAQMSSKNHTHQCLHAEVPLLAYICLGSEAQSGPLAQLQLLSIYVPAQNCSYKDPEQAFLLPQFWSLSLCSESTNLHLTVNPEPIQFQLSSLLLQSGAIPPRQGSARRCKLF